MDSLDPGVIKRDPRRRIVKTKKRKDSVWDAHTLDLFFDTLAQTANVSAATRAAHVGQSTPYKQRDKDAGFRARWDMALAEGYAHLELEMLHRQRFGNETATETAVDPQTGNRRTVRHGYTDNVAMRLLTGHRDRVERECDRTAMAASVAAQAEPVISAEENLAQLIALMAERRIGVAR